MEDDKHLSGEEKRAKLKAEYLAELKARKQMLDEAQSQQYLNNANRALAEMSRMLEADDTDAWIARLNGQSLLAEAQLDGALGSQADAQTPHTVDALQVDAAEDTAETTDLSEQAADQPPITKTITKTSTKPITKTLGEDAR